MSADWSSVEQARQQAQGAAQTANEYSAKGNTLADELRKALGERYGQSQIAKDATTARTNYLASAPQARQDVLGLVQGGNILSPTQQNAVLAAKRASALAPLMGSNLMEQAAFGTMEDLINAGTNSWNAMTQQAQGAAGLAQQNYTSLLNELVQRASQERAAEEARQKEELFPLQKEKLLADIGATNRSNLGEEKTYDKTSIDAEAQNVVAVDQNGNPYIDQDILNSVPTKIRSQVIQRANEIINKMEADMKAQSAKTAQQEKLKQQNSLWNQGLNWLGGLFKNAWDYLGRPDVPPASATKL